MKNPVLDYEGNLLISSTGTIWATWGVTGIGYPLRNHEEKKEARDRHLALIRALRGEALILGLCAHGDPAAVALRMSDGIDLDQNPAWREEVEARYAQLEAAPTSPERLLYLAVPLRFDILTQFRLMVEAALSGLMVLLGMPRWSAGQGSSRGMFGSWLFLGGDLMAKARAAAESVRKAIPGEFAPRPVSEAEHAWIFEQAHQRGVYAPLRPEAEEPGQRISGRSVPNVEISEGSEREGLRRLMPWRNRYATVQSEDMDQPSYQVLQVFAGVPAGGVDFPGVEWIDMIPRITDRSDFAVRLQFSSREKAKRKNKGAERNLEDQEEQRPDAGRITGRAVELDEVGDALTGFTEELRASQEEVEVQSTTVVISSGQTPEEAIEEAEFIRKAYKDMEFRLTAPIGYQGELFWQCLPGTPTRPITREYAQIQTGKGFSAAMPLTSAAAGHPSGIFVGLNRSTAHATPYLIDPAIPMLTDGSGSCGICGELGSGKSHLCKLIAGGVADRGGRIMAIDRSQNGEWETFGRTVGGCIVVRVIDPEYSLDPLRIFPPERAARGAQGFFGTLLDIAPMSDSGAALSSAIDPKYLRAHGVTSSGKLLEHLKSDECTIRGKEQLTARMEILASKDYGAVIFDEDLPPMPTDARMTVFRTIGVSLPTAGELAAEHRFRNLPIEKKFGSSIYQLVMEISRELCLADPRELAGFFVDEAHHLVGFPAGEEAVEDFLRVARKDLAFLVLASHDPEADFGSETLRGLIAFRILMRHTKLELAKRGLAFLELDPDDRQLIETVTKDLSPKTWLNPESGRMEVHPARRGEGLILDDGGRPAKLKVLPPASPARAEAALTSPQERKAA